MTIRILLRHCFSPSSIPRRPPIIPAYRLLLNSSFTTTTTATTNDDRTSAQLLTLSTAKQLKGDIPSAISLATLALTQQKQQQHTEHDPHAIADTSLFLGKLLQLQNNYEQAETYFTEARAIHQSLPPAERLPSTTRSEYAALSHVAHAQKKQHKIAEAEQTYLEALRGLEEAVGWEDGATNHTNFELARLYREQGRDADAMTTLATMKSNLEIVFGRGDSRVIQINGELAEVSLILGDRVGAIALLDEIVEELPGNSPEARRAFFRMEELKEEEEMGVELAKGGITVTKTTTTQK